MAKKKQKTVKAPSATPLPSMIQESVPVQLGILAVAILATYLHTLDVPFYLDDYPSIRENFSIRNLSDLDAIGSLSGARVLGYLSFALNYYLHEYDLAGYHIVNIFIHCVSSVVVCLLTRKFVEFDIVKQEIGVLAVNCLPFMVALIFALHPLQTQAVTYIVQRLASMTAMFYLSGLLFYLIGRTSASIGKQTFWIMLSLAMGFAAFYTKQNAATFPGALFLIELCILGLGGKRLILAIVTGSMLLIMLLGYLIYFVDDNLLQSLSAATIETTLVSRTEYLAIQMGVLWVYLLKSIVPLGQQFDMDFAVTSFSSPLVILYALGHVTVIGFALWTLRKRPLLSFAILFYYLAHSIESSIVPIRDFAFEHRTYLPNFGFSLFLAYCLLVFLPQKLHVSRIDIPVVGLLLFFAVLTWDRNNTWRDPERFFRHEIAISAYSLRSYGLLGEYYLRAGQDQKATQIYIEGLEAADLSFDRQNNTELAYYQNTIMALDNAGQDEEALKLLESIPWQDYRRSIRSKFTTLRGNLYAQQLRIPEAQQDFEKALALDGRNIDAKSSYGKILYMQARMKESRQQFDELLEIDPNHPLAAEAVTLLQAIDEYEAGQ